MGYGARECPEIYYKDLRFVTIVATTVFVFAALSKIGTAIKQIGNTEQETENVVIIVVAIINAAAGMMARK